MSGPGTTHPGDSGSLFEFPFYVWHDDIRPAPTDGHWAWVRTNEEAIRLLSEREVDGISLDHDLGLHHYSEAEIEANEDLLFGKGQAVEETGYDLVQWMIANDKVPARIAIHSWNPAGAQRMAAALVAAGYDAPLIAPYVVSKSA